MPEYKLADFLGSCGMGYGNRKRPVFDNLEYLKGKHECWINYKKRISAQSRKFKI